MSKLKLEQLEEQAAKLALSDNWGQEAYKTNMAILKLDQNNCAACTRLGKYHKVKDNMKKAEKMYLQALDIDPQNRAARNNLYEINRDQEENEMVESIETVKELLKEGKKAMTKGKDSLTVKLYCRSFKLEPSLENALHLAAAYQKIGEGEKNKELYEQLLQECKTKTEAKKIQKEFQVYIK